MHFSSHTLVYLKCLSACFIANGKTLFYLNDRARFNTEIAQRRMLLRVVKTVVYVNIIQSEGDVYINSLCLIIAVSDSSFFTGNCGLLICAFIIINTSIEHSKNTVSTVYYSV